MSHFTSATTLLAATILTAMTGIAVERGSWASLGQNISMQTTRGDTLLSGGNHEYSFRFLNENASRVRVEVEVTRVDETGQVSCQTESFDAPAGAEADGGRYTVIAREAPSYRIRAIQFIP